MATSDAISKNVTLNNHILVNNLLYLFSSFQRTMVLTLTDLLGLFKFPIMIFYLYGVRKAKKD